MVRRILTGKVGVYGAKVKRRQENPECGVSDPLQAKSRLRELRLESGDGLLRLNSTRSPSSREIIFTIRCTTVDQAFIFKKIK